MTGNAVAVGKRVGVKPVLARRVAAAGRNGKRVVTGDPENANRVIGKAGPIGGVSQPRREAVEALLKARRAGKAKKGVTNVRYGGRLQGMVEKAAPGTNGMGSLVPQFRGASLKSLTPQAPSFAPKAQAGAKAPGLVAAGGSKPATAGLSGVGSASSGTSAGAGAGAAGGVGKGAAKEFVRGVKRGSEVRMDLPHASKARRAGFKVATTPAASVVLVPAGVAAGAAVRKRRYDPEDERRHRQGFASATGMIAGGTLATAGGREIAGDTRRARNAVSRPGHQLATLRPSKYPPAGPTGRVSRTLKDGAGKPVPAADQRLAEAMAHDVNYRRWAQQHEAWNELAHGPRASLKGALVTRRSGGKLGAGLALAGAGLALHRHRREPRYD